METKNNLLKQVESRVKKEYENYIEKIKNQNIDKIIEESYQISIKEELTYLFYDENKFNNHKLNSLLEQENILEYLYNDWMKSGRNISEILEDNLDFCLDQLEEDYIYEKEELIKKDKKYELIKMISDVLEDVDYYEFCNNLKNKYQIDDLDLIHVYNIFCSKDGKKYLYDFFNDIKDSEHLSYLNEISVINSENFNNIEEKILPELKSLLTKEKNIDRDTRWNMIKK